MFSTPSSSAATWSATRCSTGAARQGRHRQRRVERRSGCRAGFEERHQGPHAAFVAHAKKTAGSCRMDEIISRYYVRFSVVDRPGVLAKIALSFCGQNAFLRHPAEGHEGESVPLIFMITMRPMPRCAGRWRRSRNIPVVQSQTVMIRVESFE